MIRVIGFLACLFVAFSYLFPEDNSQAENQENFRPSADEAWKIQEMSREFGYLEKELAALYPNLKSLGYVTPADQTVIIIRTGKLNEFEKREVTITTESAIITWKSGAPDLVSLRTRTATVRGMRTTITVFNLPSVRKGEQIVEPDIDFITIESLLSGRGYYFYHTLTGWDAPPMSLKTKTYTDDGVTLSLPFSQIRSRSRKIVIMEHILASYRDLQRHLEYAVSRARQNELNEMDRYIPHD